VATAEQVRTLFLSDIHLGSPGCQAALLLKFLRHYNATRIYLVGDIVDAESLARRFFWPQAHNEVLRELLDHARQGTRIVYLPGNHDRQARAWCGLTFGQIEVRRHAVHLTASGRRYLVMHGDRLDRHLDRHSWMNRLGGQAYRQLLRLNSHVNARRHRAGLGYWPLASIIKHRSAAVRRYIERFRRAAIDHATQRKVDGCIVGHIHRPEIVRSGSLEYLNCGDWVEHCTALAEHTDGRMELIDWPALAAGEPAAGNRLLPQAA
jgi:UDP-2,3-diacylglucosamine pyrophosphatase LpxH